MSLKGNQSINRKGAFFLYVIGGKQFWPQVKGMLMHHNVSMPRVSVALKTNIVHLLNVTVPKNPTLLTPFLKSNSNLNFKAF